jgi:hypothetical protein
VFSTILSLAAWVFVIFYIDPEEAGVFGKFFFFASLFLFLSGLFVTFLVWLRMKFMGEEVAAETIGLSSRQGILSALFFTAVIVLFGSGYLVWWNALLVLAGILLVEFYFLSRDK